MDLESIILNEISQSETDKYYMIHAYIESKTKTKEPTKQNRPNYPVSARRQGMEGWSNRSEKQM